MYFNHLSSMLYKEGIHVSKSNLNDYICDLKSSLFNFGK